MHTKFSLVAALMAALLSFGAARAEPITIRIAWIAVPTNLAPILFAEPGVAKHLGQSYVVQPIHFSGSAPMITALASGELDIGLLSYSTFGLAIENAGMGDLRVIADDFQDGVPGYFSDHFLVLKDSPIHKIEDLRGKVVTTNSIGGANDIAMRIALRERGLEANRDYTIVELALPNMKAALAEHKIDLMPGAIPFSLDPDLIKISRTLFVQRDVVGVTQILLWAARAPWIAEHRAALVDFLEDVVRARQWYLDPANHDAAVDIVAKFAKQPPQLFSWAFTKADTYRDPMAVPNIAAMQRNIAQAEKLGFLKSEIEVATYADLSIVKEGGARVK